MSSRIQFLTYYLPQFHPIAENDSWWGEGFTEWFNVKKATPLFKGHYQPIKPGKLGYYDLLETPNIQEEQAKLAKEHGIDGFIYYQYWFGKDKMLLEKPAEVMLKNKSIKIPFCFCWANETWKGIWHGLDNQKILIEQTYNGAEGYNDYFNYLLPFFKDTRYIKVDNKPMFHVYRFDDIPDINLFIETFNFLAKENGFDGIYFVATIASEDVINHNSVYGKVGVDIFLRMRYGLEYMFSEKLIIGKAERKIKKIVRKLINSNKEIQDRNKPLIYDYKKGVKRLNIGFTHKKYMPCAFPNWDNTARSGNKAMIFKNATPHTWRIHLENIINEMNKNPSNPPFLVIKSWNEWAEGNYLEPDQKFGLQWLKVVKRVKDKVD